MEIRLNAVRPEEAFAFECSPQAACFNACCRSLVQALTPYDVLRLRAALGLSCAEFFGRYARRQTGPGSGLPLVTLRAFDEGAGECPFVAPDGCRVYRDRPSSCRAYPLVRVLRRSRQDGTLAEEYRLLREPHCRGFEGPGAQTVGEWIAGQGLEAYNRENDRLLELISLKARLTRKALPPSLAEHAFTALYDLDRFREQHGEGFPAGVEAETAASDALEGETAWLHRGIEWLKRLLETAYAPRGPKGA